MRSSRARSSSNRAVHAGDASASARRSPRAGSLGAGARERDAAARHDGRSSAREARALAGDAGLSSSRSLGDLGYGCTEANQTRTQLQRPSGAERADVDASSDLRLKSTQQLMSMIDRLQSRLLNIQARASEQHRLLVKEQHEPPADLPIRALRTLQLHFLFELLQSM